MHNFLPIKENSIKRARIDNLLMGIERSKVVTVIAGPGYGKTQAIASFLSDKDYPIIWVKLTELDNIDKRFFDDVIKALNKAGIKYKINSLLPSEDIYAFSKFADDFLEIVEKFAKFIIVFDDLHLIHNPDILEFICHLIHIDFENVTIILISRFTIKLPNLNFYNLESHFAITTNELRFDAAEIVDVFASVGKAINHDDAIAFHNYTNGLPYSVFLASLLSEFEIDSKDLVKSLKNYTALLESSFFENDLYAHYDQKMQKLLLQLAMLDNFYLDLAITLANDSYELVNSLIELSFIYPLQNNLYAIQSMFLDFLRKKTYTLSQNEINHIYSHAGKSFLANDDYISAINYFAKIDDSDGMLAAIAMLPEDRLSRNFANFILEKIEKHTHDNEKLYFNFIKALMYGNNGEYVKSVDELIKTINICEQKTAINKHFLGELYLLLGDMSMCIHRKEFAAYYKKAIELFKDESSTQRNGNFFLIDNRDLIFLEEYYSGELEELATLVLEIFPLITRITNGSGHGTELLFIAEKEYQQLNLAQATLYANKAIYRASDKNQLDVIANSYFILMKIALLNGDSSNLDSYYKKAIEICNSSKNNALDYLSASLSAWYYVYVGDFNKIPIRIIDINNSKVYNPSALGRAHLLYALYLNVIEGPEKSTAYLEEIMNTDYSYLPWLQKVHAYLSLASSYERTGNLKESARNLRIAYQMTFENKIYAPFIEWGYYMCHILSTLKKAHLIDDFDSSWLDFISKKSASGSKKMRTIISDYADNNSINSLFVSTLSKRENEVLRLLEAGLSRNEICDEIHVSINTVKTIIRSIFNKLNVNTKEDAIKEAKRYKQKTD